MDFIKIINLAHDEERSKEQVFKGLKLAIDRDLLILFRNGLAYFNKDWFFNVFQSSHMLRSETTQIDANKFFKLQQKWWEIQYDPSNANVYKHSKTWQPLHTDNAFMKTPPKLSLFAMEKQVTEGGETTLLPLPKLVELLKERDPNLLKDLSDNIFEIVKGDEVKGNITPIIDLQKMEINWNYYRVKKSSKKLAKTIDSFYAFLKSLEVKEEVYVTKFSTGDVYIFNDLKYLHARKAFKAKVKGDRLLSHSMWHINNK